MGTVLLILVDREAGVVEATTDMAAGASTFAFRFLFRRPEVCSTLCLMSSSSREPIASCWISSRSIFIMDCCMTWMKEEPRDSAARERME